MERGGTHDSGTVASQKCTDYKPECDQSWSETESGMIVKTVRDREKGQDGKLKNEKNGWLGRAIRFLCIR